MPDKLDVVADAWLQGDKASRVDAQRLTRGKLQRVDRPTGMDEHEPIPFEFLHDEAFAAKQADADLPLEMQIPTDTPRAAHRNASFWQIRVPPRADRSIGMILPA